MLEVIEKYKEKQLFSFIYWTARIGLGITFVLSGIRKLPGVKFTILPVDNPVGAYFHAMYETGFYWNFIGIFQIIIGIMVFFNRFVVVSSILMMPVTINIFLISIALHMKGTPIITSAMVFGNIFLLLWHYKNYMPIIQRPMV